MGGVKMPYIKNENHRREALQIGEPALTAGELNYQIFYYVKHNWIESNDKELEEIIEKYTNQFLGDKPNYQRYNDMTGALIRCGKEIERRLDYDKYDVEGLRTLLEYIMENYDDKIAEYEDKKILENGDVE